MGYYTRYKLEWEGGDPKETPQWKELVKIAGSDVAEKLLAAGLAGFNRAKSVDEQVAEWIRTNENASYAMSEDGSASESCKWYDHETDLNLLSVQMPDVVFTLSGEGEEAGDIWMKYFKNGEMVVDKASIHFSGNPFK